MQPFADQLSHEAPDTLRIFVGTDRWQRDSGAELVLEHTIRKHATCPVQFFWMRAEDPGFETHETGEGGAWRTGNKPGDAWKRYGAWGTPFSCFRFVVPELCNYRGRAVYLDADMLVNGDVRELLELPLTAGYHIAYRNRSDVAVIDCEWFSHVGDGVLPPIQMMRVSGAVTFHYMQLLDRGNALAVTLDPSWNACDRMDGAPDPGANFKLLHYTVVPTQPYRPYPTVHYTPHPWQSWVKAWRDAHAEARATAV
jgi:hypothetical protein